VTATLNIVNPHGDVFTTIPDVVNVTAAQVGACNDTDEFGVTLTPSAPSYGWVGGKLRATNTATGLIQMGVRVYDPVTGRFLSTDSVYGGNENTYTYPVDPVNVSDTSGRCPCAVYGWITVEKSYWTPFRYAGSSMTDYLIARGWINDPRIVYLLGYRVGVSVTGMGGQVSVNTSNAATQSYFVSAGGRHMFTLSPYYSLQRWGSQRSIAWSLTVDIEPMTVWEIQPGSGLNVGVSLHVIMRSRYWGVVGYR
jgi:RHS repeat-associated protein